MVTTDFGLEEEGTILDAYLVAEGIDGTGLVFHPKDKKEKFGCCSLDICDYDNKLGVWIARDGKSYINISTRTANRIFKQKVK